MADGYGKFEQFYAPGPGTPPSTDTWGSAKPTQGPFPGKSSQSIGKAAGITGMNIFNGIRPPHESIPGSNINFQMGLQESFV